MTPAWGPRHESWYQTQSCASTCNVDCRGAGGAVLYERRHGRVEHLLKKEPVPIRRALDVPRVRPMEAIGDDQRLSEEFGEELGTDQFSLIL